MRIAVDMDEVLAEFMTAFLKFYNEKHQTAWKHEHFHTYHFWDIFKTSREENLGLLDEFIETEYFSAIQPVQEAFEAVADLKKDHELILVTARPREMEAETHAWLERHYPGMFTKVHISNQFGQQGAWKSKRDICKEERADIMIEDNVEYATECAAVCKTVFLIDAPWNRNYFLPENVVRVRSWKEICEQVMRTGL